MPNNTLQTFAFTAKYNQKEQDTHENYSRLFAHWRKQGVTVNDFVHERDSKNILHVHGIVTMPKGFYRKKLMLNACHLDFREMYDKEGWINYMTKTHSKSKSIDDVPIPLKLLKKSLFRKSKEVSPSGSECLSKRITKIYIII